MGYSEYSTHSYNTYRTSIASKSFNEVFENQEKKTISTEMSPVGLKIRESRDSDIHPNSVAVAIFMDGTGSMHHIPHAMVRDHLDTLMTTLISNGIPDPQIMFSVIGDYHYDRFPLQVGQFESGDKELVKWLTQSFFEGGGGGDGSESYLLGWLVGARHTAIDCWEKRQKKGILFTIGDEMCHDEVSAKALNKIFGINESVEATAKELLEEACKTWEVFHIHVNEGSYPDNTRLLDSWTNLLGMPPIVLHDQHKISEIIATTVGLVHGININSIVSAYDDTTKKNVTDTLDYVIQNYKV